MPSVVVVGNAARDIAPDDPRGWRLGGGVTYGALTAARLGLRTAALVGVDAAAEQAWELERLRAVGIELEVARLDHGPVFENVEHPAGRVQTCLDPGEPLDPSRLPPAWRDASAWILAPVAGELSDAWASVPSPKATVALGWQGLLRVLRAGEQVRRRDPGPSALVRRADLIGVSRHDLDGRLGLEAVAGDLHPGATLLLTCGDRGGLVGLRGEGSAFEWAAYPAVPSGGDVDPTGAGDVMLAGVLAARLACGPAGPPMPGTDLELGAAAASFVVEAPGLGGVAPLAAVAKRLAEVHVAR